MIRWVFLLRYPEGVSIDEGERWYLGTHTQEAKLQKGLCRYVTWKLEPAPVATPGRSLETLNRWVRLTEVCFTDWEAWRQSNVENPGKYTPAPWADPAKVQRGTAASFISETIFIGDRPEYDLLREIPTIT
jgi:hypothetical protein